MLGNSFHFREKNGAYAQFSILGIQYMILKYIIFGFYLYFLLKNLDKTKLFDFFIFVVKVNGSGELGPK